MMLAFSDDGMILHSATSTPPTDIEIKVAKKVLLSFGINSDGTRINPLWN